VELDPTGAVIPSAHVTAVPEESTRSLTAISDQRGEFVLSLPPGRSTITIAADGFLDTTENNTTADSPGQLRRFALAIAGIQDTVSVSARGGYRTAAAKSATKTQTPFRDVPQSITVVTNQLMRDQLMTSVADVVRYVPGITTHQGENNRDQIIVRGNSSSADFFVNTVRDDVQYYRDVYNLDRIEALKGPNAMIFGRGGAGGVINRVTKEASLQQVRELALLGGSYGNERFTSDLGQSLAKTVAVRLNGMFESSDSFRHDVSLDRYGVRPALTFTPSDRTTVKLAYEYLHDTRVADRGITSFRGAPADVDIATYYGDPSNSHVRANVNPASATIEHRVGRVVVRNHTLFGAYDRFYQNYVPGAVTTNRSAARTTWSRRAPD
jgi:catecholate siderophore receptor